MSDRPLCRYFMNNCCSKGDRCAFSHERNARPDMVCKYYLNGNCGFGSGCRYDHIRPKQPFDLKIPEPTISNRNKTDQNNIKTNGNTNLQIQNQRPTEVTKKQNNRLPVFQRLPSLKSEEQSQLQSNRPSTSTNGQNHVNAWSKPLKFSVDAPEFVPRTIDPSQIGLCPYWEISGDCINGDNCLLIHGDLCEMCGQFVLHPFNEEISAQHHKECLSEHEKAMKEAFINQESMKMQCGICMEQVIEVGARFGILQNCKHCFCLKCIREWRKKKESFEKDVVRACPQCRVQSDFIIPSAVWVEDQLEKDNIIANYQNNMSQKVCKYMAKGAPEDCPFGNKCFYKHQLPDGTIAEGKSPKELRSRLNRTYRLGEAINILSAMEQIQISLMEDLYSDDDFNF